MNELERLMQNLCPNGVKFVKIGDVAEVGTGSSNGNEAIDNGEYPFFVRSQTVKAKNEYEYDEEAIIIPGEGGIGEIFHYVNGKYALHQRVYRIHFTTDAINVKFILHYMKAHFKAFILQKAVSSTVTSIRKPMVEGFLIPVPPIEVQDEIVRILDNFTELTKELTKELTARKKQYEYYRDSVLTFGDAVPTVKLKDVCISVKDGMHNLPKNSTEKGEFPILSAANINNGTIDYNAKRYVDEEVFNVENKRTNVEIGDVLLTIVATIGRTAVVNSNPNFLLQRSVCVLKVNKKILPGFLKYCLDTQKNQRNMIANAHGSAQAGLYLNQVAEIEIPLPPLEEQERIVEILDRFDKLCNGITVGLPAEIEARQKQYEYYRDKLLTFKELKV